MDYFKAHDIFIPLKHLSKFVCDFARRSKIIDDNIDKATFIDRQTGEIYLCARLFNYAHDHYYNGMRILMEIEDDDVCEWFYHDFLGYKYLPNGVCGSWLIFEVSLSDINCTTNVNFNLIRTLRATGILSLISSRTTVGICRVYVPERELINENSETEYQYNNFVWANNSPADVENMVKKCLKLADVLEKTNP